MKKTSLLIIIFFIFLSCSASDDVVIKYVVTGTSASANIEYYFGNKLLILENQSLPWEYEYKLWSDQYDSFILSLGAGKLTGDDSSIVLEIYSDDRILNYLIFYGAFEKETIAAKIYLYGDSWD